jgi:hypothetical protein
MEQQRIITRRDRRNYLRQNGLLKGKARLSFGGWSTVIRDTQKQGKQIHRENEDIWLELTHSQLQKKEEAIMKSLTERGYTKEQIDSYLENWYKTLA